MKYKCVVAIVYVTALFLDILDTTIVNVGDGPSSVRSTTATRPSGSCSATRVSLAVWIPTSGWLGDRFGTKRVFLFALFAFTAGSLRATIAESMGQLIVFRVMQGVGGGMLTPVGIAMLYRAFPPAERAQAAMIVMIPTLAAPALGPVLGGLIVTHTSWRWIFLVNVPIGVRVRLRLEEPPRDHEPAAGSFDVPGFLLSGSGARVDRVHAQRGPVGGVGISRGDRHRRPRCRRCGDDAVEPHGRLPMLDLRLCDNRLFRQCNLVGLLSMASFLGLTFVMPLYLQLLRGLTHAGRRPDDIPAGVRDRDLVAVAGRMYAQSAHAG